MAEIGKYMVGESEINGKTYLTVDNSAMTYLIINAVREQQKMIDIQKEQNIMHQAEIDFLKQELANLKSMILLCLSESKSD